MSGRARERVAREYMAANPAGSEPRSTRARIIRVAAVKAQRVDWLWRGWLPRGALALVDGDPGTGKSTLTLDLAARVSRGAPMPDASGDSPRAGVVILSAEDDLARTIRPRLEAAGADLERIATLQVETEGGLRDPVICAPDLALVEEAIAQVGARLLIVDPLMAYLTSDMNANKDQDVRRALAALRALAERTGATALVVRHLNKSESANVLYRGGGSIGIIGAARAALLVARDPDDPSGERRVLAVTKSNLAPMPPSFAFRLVADSGAEHPRVVWEGRSEHGAAALLAMPEAAGEARAREEARTRDAEARALRFERAAAALRERVAEWAESGDPMRKNEDAIPFLVDYGVPRDTARELIRERNGRDWRLDGGGRRGNPEVLVPLLPAESPQESGNAESPRQTRLPERSIPAECVDSGPQEAACAEAAPEAVGISCGYSCGDDGDGGGRD